VWWWVLIWSLLGLVAAVYLAGRLWELWGQFRELGAEVERAAETLDALEVQAERLREHAGPAVPLAVFEDPRQLRRDRERAHRSQRRQRALRRAAARPAWARRVD
jgi:predicted phage tail protein